MFQVLYRNLGTTFVLLSSIAALADIGIPKKSVVDMHVHFACVEAKNDCYIHPDFRKHWKYNIYMQALGVTQEQVDAKGDDFVFEQIQLKLNHSQYLKQSVILAIDGVYDRKTGELDKSQTQVKFSNRFLYEKIKSNPHYLMGVSINPFSKEALKELEWAHLHNAALVKWIPCIMGFSPDENDPRLTNFYKKLVEYNIPLLSHTGNEGTFLHSNDEMCNPNALRTPLKMGVTVIAAHISSKGQFALAPPTERGRAIATPAVAETESNKINGSDIVYQLMKEFPKFYVDISAVTQINRYNHLELAKPLLATNRVLYGSDWPLISAQIMGLPLVSWRYYGFQLSKEIISDLKASESDFDKDIILKTGLGIPQSLFDNTVKFFSKDRN